MPDVAAMSSPASHLNEGAENYRCILVYVTPTENGGGGGGDMGCQTSAPSWN